MAEINDVVIPSKYKNQFYGDFDNYECEGDPMLFKQDGLLTAYAIERDFVYTMKVDTNGNYYLELTKGNEDRETKRMVLNPSDKATVNIIVGAEEKKDDEDEEKVHKLVHVAIKVTTLTNCVDCEFTVENKKILKDTLKARFYDCKPTNTTPFELIAIEFESE